MGFGRLFFGFVLFVFTCLGLYSFIFMKNDNQMKQTLGYETTRKGKSFAPITFGSSNQVSDKPIVIEINPNKQFQKITGFGGSFTEATCHLLSQLSEAKRKQILEAYFSEDGANYSMARTTMASCDFSLGHYTYAAVADDLSLSHFTIEHDQKEIIPIIKAAQAISKEGFKVIASPWTSPPWMKDNNHWVGGKLKLEHYPTFSLYFQKYLEAYQKEKIDIWGLTVINEPHGNGNNWESTLFSPKEMTDFVEFHLGPRLEKSAFNQVKILGYDQNRAGLKEWVDEMYRSENSRKYYAGTAVHWYESTYDYFPDALDYAKSKQPEKFLIQTEACIDAEVPHWQEDDWYWQKEATDWGWDWASPEDKHLHPKYAPVHRYATDIIGCLNHGVDGWIDWNMVLDKQGGPNWFKNWCIAPVIVDTASDEVYYTPLYFIMKHFSKFIRPEAHRIGWTMNAKSDIMTTAIKNKDNSIVVVLFNPTTEDKNIEIAINGKVENTTLAGESLQTIIIQEK